MRLLAALVFALLAVAPAGARDDCDAVMAQLASAQREADSLIDVIDSLEEAIAAPSWNATTDGWMVDAVGWAITDLVGALNETAVAAERAHQSHCY